MSVRPWWETETIYQVYPRSFADSDGDGHGDLQGVIDHLDYLEWLGARGLWLSPCTKSANFDWGYDTTDYEDVQPDSSGDLAVFDELVARAGERDLRVILDIVPNHTSDRHPWFEESRRSRRNRYRDWYVWVDPASGGGPPNNWVSAFGGPAWTLDERTGQYYLHNFSPQQPDLNWWNREIRAEFARILRFWFERSVAGFRVDVAHAIFHDRLLRDNPPALTSDRPSVWARGQRPVYNMNRPQVHGLLRGWRTLADSYEPGRVLLGETMVHELERLASFYGRGDELHLAFNYPFLAAPLARSPLQELVHELERLLPAGAWPSYTWSNHDFPRLATRLGGQERKVRVALLLLLTLRGTPILYYGDEIGMEDGVVPAERTKDTVARKQPGKGSRDPCRTPMQWSAAAGAGFTRPGVEPWLPFGDHQARNVEDQEKDPDSTLSLTRSLLAARRSFAGAPYRLLAARGSLWHFARGDVEVLVNLGDEAVETVGKSGLVLTATEPDLVRERISKSVALPPWQGLVLA